MSINIKNLLKGEIKVLPVRSQINIEIDESLKAMGILEASEITAHGQVVLRGAKAFLELRIEGELVYACARCLDPAPYRLKLDVDKCLESPGSGVEDCIPLKGTVLELDGFILEETLLNLPGKVLCSEDCRGICPVCGINKNHETCHCEEDLVDPRFDVLDDFFS
ncbi:MAG: hypothetical protein AVO33_02895 [delta proteobacterium ML8_F1]|nr:MAG: hypothetical protein AVO33_02895 [delta proteobacterium ML8_F1]